MKWIQGWDRQEEQVLPARVEDYVGAENPVRFVEVFAEGLDLRGLGFRFPKEDKAGRGRPGYRPADMLKLYLYGYVHGVRSSRRLERECRCNLEVMWLLGNLVPDFKTIADFRRDNAAAFKAVARRFTEVCRELDLFGRQLLAVDGTKLKAQNARDRNWSRDRLEKQLQLAQEKLAGYLAALDRADTQEDRVPEQVAGLQAKLARWQERQSQVEERLEKLSASGQEQLSETDPDSRGMKGAHGHLVGYNLQGVADAKHHLLAVLEVTNQPCDQGQLAPMAEAAKEVLGIKTAELLAEGGYYKSQDIKHCQEIGLEPYVPEPGRKDGLYDQRDFTYDAQANVYRCPAGQQLRYRRTVEDKGTKRFNYDHPAACAGCALRSKCTKSTYRVVSRWEHAPCLEQMREKVAASPTKMALRKTLIEHPWGTIKHLLAGGFLVKGLQRVGAEVSLAHIAYNLKRALAVVGLSKLMAACQNGKVQPQVA